MSSEESLGAGGVGVGGIGASSCARELAKRRVSSASVQTPITPVTPVALTPMLAAHIFAEGNVMEDLQLAAELGKTLLERNKDLENTIKDQRSVIDDKTQEIEYLSKQTAALREVNDSRLRIYEQLEISIQELENSNQRLTSESHADRKKIKSLTATIEHLEAKCDELQKSLDDSKAAQHKQMKQQLQQEEDQNDRSRAISRRLQSPEEVALRRSVSCENSSQCCENLATECVELQMKLESLQTKLKATQEEAKGETKKKEDLEIELECASQENAVLREQVLVLKEKENNVRSFEDELASVDDTSSSRICRKCMGLADETGSSITMQDFTEELEDMDTSYEALQGDGAIVRLKNGGYAFGSQESLASMGQLANSMISHESSPRTEGSEAPNSLLSELDTQYRILIEKYEALLQAREQRDMHETITIHQPPSQTIIDSGVDEISGPMSLVMTDISAHNEQSNVSGLCQRCATCSCDLKLTNTSSMEEHFEVETSSSGFSEGETRLCSKTTQTDVIDYFFYNKDFDDATTPTPLGNSITPLNLQTPMNPCESRFQTAPIYRRIFHEIFEVLKKDVDKQHIEVDIIKIYDSGKEEIDSISTTSKTSRSKKSNLSLRDENEENKNPNIGNNESDISVKSKQPDKKKDEPRYKENPKPARPDFLDLDSSSRCSSRSRRRKRHQKHRNSSNQHSNTEPSKEDEESEQIQVENASQEKPEPPPAPINTPAMIPPIPYTSSALPKANKPKEAQEHINAGKKVRCEHKKRKTKRQSRSTQLLQNKLLSKAPNSNPTTSHTRYQPYQPYQQSAWSNSGTTPALQNLPSVQVAKLIRFERTYAEVLKSRRS